MLTINDTDDDDFYTTSFILKHILTITNIHYLEIERSIDIPLFIRLLNALTDVETLKIYSIICDDRKVDYKKFSVASSIKKRSKIKNVYIKNVKNIDDIFLLMTLCPHITYLKIDNINVINQNVNVESIVNDFINRSCNNSTNLVRLLCFRIPAADDGTIEKLKRTIITNGITCDYTIKRIVDRVYIEWKLEPTIDSS
ncbi:unnamed protein product [Rotaria sp. Silwood1]|nr:unnamed protein product [Rotaria sp. Silwood1]